jgi:hypothetical protein
VTGVPVAPAMTGRARRGVDDGRPPDYRDPGARAVRVQSRQQAILWLLVAYASSLLTAPSYHWIVSLPPYGETMTVDCPALTVCGHPNQVVLPS